MKPPPFARLQESALLAAAAATAILEEKRGAALEVGTKASSRDLVTDADRAAEAAIAAVLRERHPDHRLLAEEGTVQPGAAGGVRWIVDPLDGTVNFARGIGHYCVSIAAEDAEGLAVAVIQDPVRGEIFTAVRGEGSYLAGRRLAVREPVAPGEAILATGFSYQTAEREENARRAARLIPRAAGFRRMGSAALDLAYVAAGRLDGFWEQGLKPWDLAAGLLLVTEAGGRVSGLPGQAAPLESGTVIAAGPTLHAALERELGVGGRSLSAS